MQQAVVISEPDPTYRPWGMLAAIDVHGCEFDPLADPDNIRAFVPALIDAIGMRAHGPLLLERLGLVGDAVHRNQLDYGPCRRGVGSLFRRCVLVPAV